VNDTQLLERLSTAYASVSAPAPSAELLECMARGGVVDRDDDGGRDAVVVPLVVRRPRTRTRTRYLVAAAVATLALFSGLAVAGALPDPVQRQVSSFASHFGLDLPAPGGTDHRSGGLRSEDSTRATAPVTLPVTTEPVVPPAAGTGGAAATPAPPTPTPTNSGSLSGTLGQVGALGGSVTGSVTGSVATTVPPSGGSPLPQPTLTLPPPTVPEVTLPPTTLPPTTLPPVTLPKLPPLTLPGL
jgi:hypothetical protein